MYIRKDFIDWNNILFPGVLHRCDNCSLSSIALFKYIMSMQIWQILNLLWPLENIITVDAVDMLEKIQSLGRVVLVNFI